MALTISRLVETEDFYKKIERKKKKKKKKLSKDEHKM
jgi:hypothetical protein